MSQSIPKGSYTVVVHTSKKHGRTKQFFFRSGKKLDNISEKIFHKLIVPLRIRTGWTGAFIYKIFEVISIPIFFSVAIVTHNWLVTLIFGLFALLTAWVMHYIAQDYEALSTEPLENITAEMFVRVIRKANTRIKSWYWTVALLVWFAMVGSWWWLVWAVAMQGIDLLKAIALTSGGEQTKRAKEKKPSLINLLRLLPGSNT